MKLPGKPLWHFPQGALRTALLLAAPVLAATTGVAVDVAGRNRGPESATAASASGSTAPAAAFEPEKGRFRIVVNGQQVGSEDFEIAANGANWVARGVTDLQSPNGATHVSGTLELRPDATPIRYDWSTQGAKKASAAVTFDGLTATIELHLENAKPFTQQFTFTSPKIAVLDNNLNYQFAVLARLYDWNKKGPQNFSVLVPQELTPGTATVESLGKQDSGGKSLEELRVKTEDNEIDLYLDGPRLVRVAVPSAKAEIIRE